MANLDTDSPLIVYLEAYDDLPLTTIKSWYIDSDYLVSTDGFEFVYVDDRPEFLRDLEGQPVRLEVAGATQLVGRIDETQRGDNGFAVSCTGRDYLADLVECNIDPTFVVKEKQTLGDAILRACAPVGITKIAPESDVAVMLDIRQGIPRKTRARRGKGGKDNRSKSFKDATLEDLKPDLAQGIFEFLNPICSRHNCTIQPTHSRDTVLVVGPFYDQEAGFQINRSRSGNGGVNNVISASVRRNYGTLPTTIIVQGQGAPRAGEPMSNSTIIIDTWSEAQHFGGELARKLDTITWTGRRKPEDTSPLGIDKIYRLNVFRDERARSPEQLENAARRLFADHLKRTLEYKVKLRGHLDPYTGAIWAQDTIVTVNDEVCDIQEDLWVQARRLSFTEGEGPMTELTCIRPGSFEI